MRRRPIRVIGGPVLGTPARRIRRQGRGQASPESPARTQEHHLDTALDRLVQERRGQSHPSVADHLPDPPEIQPEQGLLAVGHHQPIASGPDHGALAVDIHDRLDGVRLRFTGRQGGSGDRLAQETYAVLERGDMALAPIELQP